MKVRLQNKEAGFTLIEVVVALGLLIMVFGGVTSLALVSSEAERSSKNNLIAANLAREAQDAVRYQRDLNYILAVSPFTSIATESDNAVYNFNIEASGTIGVEVGRPNVTLSSPLYICNNLYTTTVCATTTNFRRLVSTTYHIASGALPARIDVVVKVYWKEDTKRNTYTLTSELSDWR